MSQVRITAGGQALAGSLRSSSRTRQRWFSSIVITTATCGIARGLVDLLKARRTLRARDTIPITKATNVLLSLRIFFYIDRG